MANIEYEKPIRGRPISAEPMKPERVQQVMHLREVENMRWRQIGPILGISPQGACLLYNLWRKRGWRK